MWAWKARECDFLQAYRRLEGFFELVVANVQHSKAVPGRKTDVQDAEWIASLLQHGLVNPSFVPSQKQQDLRDLTRLRVSTGPSNGAGWSIGCIKCWRRLE